MQTQTLIRKPLQCILSLPSSRHYSSSHTTASIAIGTGRRFLPRCCRCSRIRWCRYLSLSLSTLAAARMIHQIEDLITGIFISLIYTNREAVIHSIFDRKVGFVFHSIFDVLGLHFGKNWEMVIHDFDEIVIFLVDLCVCVDLVFGVKKLEP